MYSLEVLIIGHSNHDTLLMKNQLEAFGADTIIKLCEWKEVDIEKKPLSADVIIIDDNNSENKTSEILYELKQNEYSAEIPVIVSISKDKIETVQEALEAGAIDFIKKPYDQIEILSRVRSALSLSSSLSALKKQAQQVNDGHAKVESILKGMLPSEIIEEIRATGFSRPKKYREASVLFSDFVDFTSKVSQLSPKILIEELSEIFSAFDLISQNNLCTRIKTMGDAYIAVAGIPTPCSDHAIQLIKTAIDMRDFIMERNKIANIKWDIRIGIHSGSVVGSVLGKDNYFFDIFGDTVNTASRFENQCEPNQINISKTTYLLSRHAFRFIQRLDSHIKGKGAMKQYYLNHPIKDFGLEDIDHDLLFKKLQKNNHHYSIQKKNITYSVKSRTINSRLHF